MDGNYTLNSIVDTKMGFFPSIDSSLYICCV